jgi:hypothetical protein
MSMVKSLITAFLLVLSTACVSIRPAGAPVALGATNNCAAQGCMPFGYGPGWQAYQLRHPAAVPVYVAPRR